MRFLCQNLLKKHKRTFTLVEVCLVCGLMCLLVWSSRHVYLLYRAILFSSAIDQVTAVCHGLVHQARLTGADMTLRIIPPASYSIDTNPVVNLPAGIMWGVGDAVVYGPPSRPTQKVRAPVVGGECEDGAFIFTWQATGARTPGTLYMTGGDNRYAAITLPRSARGMVTLWRLENGGWVKR